MSIIQASEANTTDLQAFVTDPQVCTIDWPFYHGPNTEKFDKSLLLKKQIYSLAIDELFDVIDIEERDRVLYNDFQEYKAVFEKLAIERANSLGWVIGDYVEYADMDEDDTRIQGTISDFDESTDSVSIQVSEVSVDTVPMYVLLPFIPEHLMNLTKGIPLKLLKDIIYVDSSDTRLQETLASRGEIVTFHGYSTETDPDMVGFIAVSKENIYGEDIILHVSPIEVALVKE